MRYKGLAISVLAVAVLAAVAFGGGDEEAEPTAESVAASPTSVPASTPTVVTAPSPTPSTDTSSSEPVSEVGTLRMLVSDQENAIADFAQLIVSIETVSVSSDGGLIDLDVAPEDREVDLVQLQGDAAEEIVRAELAVGTYSKVFLRIGEVRGILADGVTEAEVSVPSGSLQLNKPFEVAPDATTVFIYDISVVSAGPAGGDVKST